MLMPLSMCSCGREVCIKSINGGNKLNNRLNSMGLQCNCKVTVVDNNNALTVKLDNSKIAIGHGIAHKIMCEEI